MAILEVKNIEKHFGETKVLKDVSFNLEEGNALAIIGSSGSGKTTLLRCLNFLETPNKGVITVKGETLFDASLGARVNDSDLRTKRLHF
jgi:polar amino acid transport system ATP-binding protein